MKKSVPLNLFRNLVYIVAIYWVSIAVTAQENKNMANGVEQAILMTDLGPIEIDLYVKQAPKSVANFISYIEAGAFDSGRFYRVVRLDNDNGAPKIEVIQGGANTTFTDFAPISLETTQQTGIQHLDGVLSMARGEPNTATSEFFICIGPQPSLDFGGMRNPDGQGFAAFGRVTKGMDIVKKIHLIREALTVEDSYVKGQMLANPVLIRSIKRIKK
jgi:peptidyl-prolyl cis-trans isomerase A (cyclophilin A)